MMTKDQAQFFPDERIEHMRLLPPLLLEDGYVLTQLNINANDDAQRSERVTLHSEGTGPRPLATNYFRIIRLVEDVLREHPEVLFRFEQQEFRHAAIVVEETFRELYKPITAERMIARSGLLARLKLFASSST